IARFGPGDVQWLTAGRGIVHFEMFPLLKPDKPHPLELFQILLNLPRTGKMVDPHFSMLLRGDIPTQVVDGTEITGVAGKFGEVPPPPAPPRSWAALADGDVAIWTIKMAPRAQWTIPAARPDTNRTLYFFRGSSVKIGGESLARHAAV